MSVETFKCPNCGAMISPDNDKCSYCGAIYKIHRIRETASLEQGSLLKLVNFYAANPNMDSANISAAICCMALKQYDVALKKLDSALQLNPFDYNAYFYKAIALMDGKKPFLQTRERIKQAETCLISALNIKNSASVYFLWAIIRYDYYYRKRFCVEPTYKELFNNAVAMGLNSEETSDIYKMLGNEWKEIFI